MTLDDDDPEAIAQMLEFVYCDTYLGGRQQEEENSEKEKPTTLLTHAKMYILGDKYQIELLKMLAVAKYESAVTKEWSQDSFTASIQLIYANTMENDRALKDIAIKAAVGHLRVLFNRKDFQTLILAVAEVGRDIIVLQLAAPEQVDNFCPICDRSDCITPTNGLSFLDGQKKEYCYRCQHVF